VASPPSVRISPATLSGSIDLFFQSLPTFPNDFSINGEGFTRVCALYFPYVTLAAK
jgi:hypothetical protein